MFPLFLIAQGVMLGGLILLVRFLHRVRRPLPIPTVPGPKLTCSTAEPDEGTVEYLHLRPGTAPPALNETEPFKAVVMIEADVAPEWQYLISDWLVRSGCLYMMAWGRKCIDWDTSVDESNHALVTLGEFPEEHFVMTTWHDGDPLKEVFWFSMMCAFDDTVDLNKTYILHIAPESEAAKTLKTFQEVQEGVRRGEIPDDWEG